MKKIQMVDLQGQYAKIKATTIKTIILPSIGRPGGGGGIGGGGTLPCAIDT